eukprot:6330411-Amphidinium_carterae.2
MAVHLKAIVLGSRVYTTRTARDTTQLIKHSHATCCATVSQPHECRTQEMYIEDLNFTLRYIKKHPESLKHVVREA